MHAPRPRLAYTQTPTRGVRLYQGPQRRREVPFVVVGADHGGGERRREELGGQLLDLVAGDRRDAVEALGDRALAAEVELGAADPVHPRRGVLEPQNEPATQVALGASELG